jgi:putative glycosyltransferase (TIGR04372 family)
LAELFRKSTFSLGAKRPNPGTQAERPFQILGLIETHELGDLISNVVFLSTLANQFDHARLHVKFRDVRPYSREVMELSPWIDLAEPLPGEWPRLVRMLLPPTTLLKPWRPMQVGSQKGENAYLYDVIVTSLMAREDAVHGLPNPVPLRLPEAKAADLRAALAAEGIRPDRWFAVFHYREGGYKFRPIADRDSDPAAFDGLVDSIIALGGQAVRLGHPGMTSFKPRAGFIDLSKKANNFLLHAAAVSHARFMIAGPSGPMMLAPAFAVPHSFVDVIDTRGYWDVKNGDALTHLVMTPKGDALRNESLLASGLLDDEILAARMASEKGYRVRKATSEELATVAKRLYDRTTDCEAWRPPAKAPGGPKPNSVVWPPRLTYPTQWVEL